MYEENNNNNPIEKIDSSINNENNIYVNNNQSINNFKNDFNLTYEFNDNNENIINNKNNNYKQDYKLDTHKNYSNNFNINNEIINVNKQNSENLHKSKSSISASDNSLIISKSSIGSKIRIYDFYINNPELNKKKLKHFSNLISTTKYNFITFIPKSLIIQFYRLSNVYFLATAIIQSIPIISPLSSLTAIFPLIFVLFVSMVRELIEDLSRMKYDNINNKMNVFIFKNKKFQQFQSSQINVGDIILIKDNNEIPCDIIILDSNTYDGICYVETSTLDGEKTLKNKNNNNTYGIFCNKNSTKFKDILNTNFDLNISGHGQSDFPNNILNKCDGYLKLLINGNSIEFPFNINNTLLKGSILKNSGWVIGMALYTGSNNKIILNNKLPSIKLSKIEKKMNKFLVGIFIFQMILCSSSSILYRIFYYKHKQFYDRFITLKYNINVESLLVFFTYFLLLNTLIPISLIVTLEIVKLFLSFFINWDIKMFSFVKQKFSKVNSISILEELGNVDYIFSDKTGTLTSNKMIFKYAIIDKKIFKYNNNIQNNYNLNNFNKEKILFGDKYFGNLIKENLIYLNNPSFQNGSDDNNSLNNSNQNNKNFISMIKIINEYWKALSLCNECIANQKKEITNNNNNFVNNNFYYTGINPDDVELVRIADLQGFSLLNSQNGMKNLKINDDEKKHEILNYINFSSDRKRMSIILKDESNVIKIYTKGADCEILKRLSKNNNNIEKINFIKSKIDKYSKKGYRTLLIGYKEISKEDYEKWNNELKTYKKNIQRKKKLIEKNNNKIENELILLGGTIVEDKLQDGVPECIKELRMAGIKIWVLTGDKCDTAENIALSCNLINENQKIFRIISLDNHEKKFKKSFFPEIHKFQKEFEQFIIDKKNNGNVIYDIDNFFSFDNDKSNLELNLKKKEDDKILCNLNINNNKENFNNSNLLLNINNIKNKNSFSQKEEEIIKKKYKKNKKNFLFSNKKLDIFYEESMFNFKDNSKLPQFSMIIESSILSAIFANKVYTYQFFKIALLANTVICCRVSPIQKSKVIKFVKNFSPNSITLAIGDGGNDVSMLLESHIGIGIYGEEGNAAVQASDVSIGEFKFLRRLLLFHGRVDNNRIGQLILYFFYKNFVFTTTQYFFGFFCFMSGQTIIDDWLITLYNLVFTALPLVVQALSDFDILEKDSREAKKLFPFLYRESREVLPKFNIQNFIFYLSRGLLISTITFYIVVYVDYHCAFNIRGDYGNMWYVSIKIYTNILISISITLFLNIRYIIIWFPIILFLSFGLYIAFLFCIHFLVEFNSCATVIETFKSEKFYFNIILVVCIQFIVDYVSESSKFMFSKEISAQLMILNGNKKKTNKEIKNYFLRRSRLDTLFKNKIMIHSDMSIKKIKINKNKNSGNKLRENKNINNNNINEDEIINDINPNNISFRESFYNKNNSFDFSKNNKIEENFKKNI